MRTLAVTQSITLDGVIDLAGGWFAPGELLADPLPDWATDWVAAGPDSVTRQTKGSIE